MDFVLDDAVLDAYRRDGAVCLRGAFSAAWLDKLAAGVARNMAEPGPMVHDYTAEERAEGIAAKGRFFGDYCNWRRIPEFEDFVLNSPAAGIAARLMESRTVQFYHEHVLVKEPGTDAVTPWHHDLPYYNVEGDKTLSIWLPLDPVARAVCPEFVAGSHRWPKLYYPRKFKDHGDYAYAGDAYESVPDIDAARDDYDILSWELAPGDALAFDFRTLHGAPANETANRRRGVATRWLGDDVRFCERPGRTSPPYPDIGLKPGDCMREDWFPVVWPR